MDTRDSLENVESKWINEIAEHCAGAKLVLVALKCDLREEVNEEKDDDGSASRGRSAITYNEGLEVARRIGALRYLGTVVPRVTGDTCARRNLTFDAECSAMRNRGVNEAFTEAARVALTVKPTNSQKSSDKCIIL